MPSVERPDLFPHAAAARPGDSSETQSLLRELIAAHDRFPASFDALRAGLVLYDRSGNFVRANRAALAFLGVGADELRGRRSRARIERSARERMRTAFTRAAAGETVEGTTAVLVSTGEAVQVRVTLVPAAVDGTIAGVYASLEPVAGDAERRLEAALREQTERMRELSVLAAAPERGAEEQIVTALELACKRLHCDCGFVATTRADAVAYLYAVGAWSRAAGATEPLAGSLHAFLLDRGGAAVFDTCDIAGVSGFVGTPIDIDGQRIGTLCLLRSRAQAQPFSEADRDFVGLVGTLVSSVLERKQRHRAETLAFYDPLTGLPNRTLLGDRMEQAIASARRQASIFALHFYDLDNFKNINDEHGHLRGDDVLRALARRFERIARHEDTVARIGGDEFVVLQPGVHSRDDIEKLARRLQDGAAEPLEIGGSIYRLTISGGIALFPQDGAEPDALLHCADSAMYRVKQRGRNDISFFTPPS